MPATKTKPAPPNLTALDDEQLLDLRFCELGLTLEGTWLEKCIAQLYKELSERNISLHPPCYLADEWLCPDGEPVIGIPFFLAHPRLKALEKKMMLEAEGGDSAWCMRLLRHETGHALNYAYLLHRRRRWRELFGPFSAEYPERYKYRPYSKRFVRHLDDWYAQYHPDEDFAETFAVWLDPKSRWRRKYRGWQALEKLEYVDQVMTDLPRRTPKHPVGQRHWDVSRMRSRLRTYYKKKRESHADYYPDFHDFHLKQIFAAEPADGSMPADRMIRQHRREIRNSISLCTGEKKFLIDSILRDILARCRELKLRAHHDPTTAMLQLSAYITSLTMNYLYTGTFKRKRR